MVGVVIHLTQLKLVGGPHRDGRIQQLKLGVLPLEIKARIDLARGLVQGVANLL